MTGEVWRAAIENGEDGARVLSPSVGFFRPGFERGLTLEAGASLGTLESLGRRRSLRLPEDIGGVPGSGPGEPRGVAWGEELLVLQLEGAGVEEAATFAPPLEGVFLSPGAGRFHRKPDPESPAFLDEGDKVVPGTTLGLLEVMKTFHAVKYEAGPGLSANAKVVRFLVQDGDGVDAGDSLVEVEPG
jgi:acetyl-CoA carboxylase biotin carboxyl carrier protein